MCGKAPWGGVVCVCVRHVRSCFMCCMCDSVCVCVCLCVRMRSFSSHALRSRLASP